MRRNIEKWHRDAIDSAVNAPTEELYEYYTGKAKAFREVLDLMSEQERERKDFQRDIVNKGK